MPDKILVTYASRTGTTAGVAEAIGKIIAGNNAIVEILPMKDVKDLTSYSAVIAGSAIQDRQGVAEWLEPVRALARPISEGLFAGALDIIKIPSFGDRLKFRISVLFGVWKEGDHRDWNEINSWAANLYLLLNNHKN